MPNKSLYTSFLDMKREIEKHKWIESEKCGRDIGFEIALIEWITKHRDGWLKQKQEDNG